MPSSRSLFVGATLLTGALLLVVMGFGRVRSARAGSAPTGAGDATPYAISTVPPRWLHLYQDAARDCPGLPWPVLAAIGTIESRHTSDPGVSSAGAVGPMQFLPSTWATYGVDADGDGKADPYDPVDAVHAAARFLCANGGRKPATLRRAIWDYNHANWYISDVLGLAAKYGPLPSGI